MSIHNFYLVALCAVWVLVLILLQAKVLADSLRRFLLMRRRSRIALAFSPDCPRRRSRRIRRRLQRYARNQQLMCYICDCCSTTPPGPLTRCLTQIFEDQIAALPEEDDLGRCLLARNIARSRLSTHAIDRFLEEEGLRSRKPAAAVKLCR